MPADPSNWTLTDWASGATVASFVLYAVDFLRGRLARAARPFLTFRSLTGPGHIEVSNAGPGTATDLFLLGEDRSTIVDESVQALAVGGKDVFTGATSLRQRIFHSAYVSFRDGLGRWHVSKLSFDLNGNVMPSHRQPMVKFGLLYWSAEARAGRRRLRRRAQDIELQVWRSTRWYWFIFPSTYRHKLKGWGVPATCRLLRWLYSAADKSNRRRQLFLSTWFDGTPLAPMPAAGGVWAGVELGGHYSVWAHNAYFLKSQRICKGVDGSVGLSFDCLTAHRREGTLLVILEADVVELLERSGESRSVTAALERLLRSVLVRRRPTEGDAAVVAAGLTWFGRIALRGRRTFIAEFLLARRPLPMF
ncbi:hypothetical protein [Luteitalea sp.]|uniref:hypothetical protein n=1 Tax=Luteitalea sp. TaxID=2004800 RepID=UPI0025BE2E33|nr:hypothetical protein [Luteitalea sp.]